MLAGFRDALTREILLTERLRIKAVIVTLSLLVVVLSLIYIVVPSSIARVLHGHYDLARLYAVCFPFLLFVFFVLHLLSRRLELHRCPIAAAGQAISLAH